MNVAVATQVLLVHRLNTDSKSIFYIPFPAYDSLAIYYYEAEEAFKGKYFLFNTFTGEVQVSESYVNDSKFIVIPIVDVVEQEFLPKDFIEKYYIKKKSKKKKEECLGEIKASIS
ncbi:MAG: hypothetical protein LM580_06535 [Thermofilum sp.]|nr:hypothetical protein [Thermofilum sp.]